MSLENVGANNKESRRLLKWQRGPFLASWLSRRNSLATEAGDVEQAENPESTITQSQFKQAWSGFFKRLEAADSANQATELGQTADQQIENPPSNVQNQTIAEVSDSYKGELAVNHDDEPHGQDSSQLLPAVSPPSAIFTPVSDEDMTPADYFANSPLVLRQNKSLTPEPSGAPELITGPLLPQSNNIMPSRRSYLNYDSIDSDSSGGDQKAWQQPITSSSPSHIKDRSSSYLQPLPVENVSLPSQSVDYYHPVAVENTENDELANELSHETQTELNSVGRTSPTHVGAILASHPVINQPTVSQINLPPATPPPFYELAEKLPDANSQPIYSISPLPKSSTFFTPDWPISPVVSQLPPLPPDQPLPTEAERVYGETYRRAIISGVWGGIFTLFVVIIINLLRS